jgi:nitroimidazol reductase NimA-like FMN-containing flavoprotein (pyridoxamine 5'-phosphate oxidase superfamily)
VTGRSHGHGVDDMEELSSATCLTLLRSVAVGRIAVATDDGGADIFPVNFVVDHGTVVFRTAPGTKVDRIIATQRIAFEADHFDWYERIAWSVVLKGAASVVHSTAELADLFEVEVIPWHPSDKPYFVRLVPDSTTGRRFRVDHRHHH